MVLQAEILIKYILFETEITLDLFQGRLCLIFCLSGCDLTPCIVQPSQRTLKKKKKKILNLSSGSLSL